MAIDFSKLQKQKELANAWKQAKGVGTIVCPTGFGKTYMALLQIVTKMFLVHKEGVVRVVVPNIELINDWNQAIEECIDEPDRKRIIVNTITYYQAKINKDFEALLCIFDEVHEYYSPERAHMLDERFLAKFKLGLTATFFDKDGRHIFMEDFLPIVAEVTEEEALDNGWISKHYVFNLGIELPPKQKQLYEDLSENLSKHLEKFNGSFIKAMYCLQGGKDRRGIFHKAQWYRYQVAQENGYTYAIHQALQDPKLEAGLRKKYEAIAAIWSPNVIVGYAKQVMVLTKKRKEMLYNSITKSFLVIDIIKHLNNPKTIIFSQSTNFVEDTCAKLNKQGLKAVAYHSTMESRPLRSEKGGNPKDPSLFGTGAWIRYKTGKRAGERKLFGKTTLKKLAMTAIRSGQVNNLVTSSTLDKGTNIPDLKLGIITSTTSNFNQGTQRKGRTTRVNQDNPDDIAMVVNIYFINTVEERWLRGSQEKYNQKYVFWIDSIDEISENPEETVKDDALDFL